MARLVLGLSLLLTSLAQAAGFYVGEVGTRGLGRAGADVVNPGDGYALWRNPAALANQRGAGFDADTVLVQLQLSYDRSGPFTLEPSSRDIDGHRLQVGQHKDINPTDVGLEDGQDWRDVFSNGSKYESERGVSNQSSPFVLGCSDLLGGGFDGRGHCPILEGVVVVGERVHQVKGLTLALGVYGPPTGGYWFWNEAMATDPGAPEASRYLEPNGLDKRFVGPQRYSLIDRDVAEVFYHGAAAYRFNRYLAVGLGLQAVQSGMRQRLAVSADSLGTEDPSKDVVLNIRVDQPPRPSANVGVWSNPWAGLELGASYQMPRPVTATGTVDVEYIAPGVVSEGYVIDDQDARAQVRFAMPAIARAGALYRLAPWFDLELALVFEQWSTWQSTSVQIDGLTFSVPQLIEGVELAPVVQPKLYQDTWSVRLGGDVDPLAALWPGHLTLRGGVQAETSAVPPRTLDVSLIDSDKLILALGAELSYMGLKLRAAYQRNILADVSVDNTLAYVVAPWGEFTGDELRTAAANGTYRASFDVIAFAVGLDVIALYDALFGDES